MLPKNKPYRRVLATIAGALLAPWLFAGLAQAQTPQTLAQPYSKHFGWTIEVVPANPRTGAAPYCQATTIFGSEYALRFVSGQNLFAIDFMGFGSHALGNSYDVIYWVDNPRTGSSAVARLIKDVDGVEWMRIEEPPTSPAARTR